MELLTTMKVTLVQPIGHLLHHSLFRFCSPPLRAHGPCQQQEEATWQDGKVSGGVYTSKKDHIDFMCRVYSMYYVTNALHPDVWPSVRKMEAEVIRMTATMLGGGPSVCGAMTTGGSESIIMALKAYRDWARETRPHVDEPEIIAPTTAHAAFLKGCQMLRMKYVMVDVHPDTQCVDLAAVRRALNSNTVALVGSACTFPHGMVDDIRGLAAIAREHNLGLHVDSCLGGYILPWLKKLVR